MFTQKHFEAVAELLSSRQEQGNDDTALAINRTLGHLAYDFVNLFANDNPRFDNDRFLEAAGFGE